MARILHMADMHLDAPFTSRLSLNKAKLRRSEQREVFSKIISIAKTEADVLLISGDLFDSGNVSPETAAFLKRSFSEIADIPVFISAGNHDPLSESPLYAHGFLGGNVTVFGGGTEYYDLDDLSLRICGASFTTENGSGMPRIDDFEKHGEYANILVIHGDVRRSLSENHDMRYNPITVLELEESGFDYAALGHIHRFGGIKKSGRTTWAYPGIPEPRGFDEGGECGIILGDVARGSAELKHMSVAKRNYRLLEIEIVDNADNEAIIAAVSSVAQENSRDIYRITVKGRVDRLLKLDFDLISERVKDMAFDIELIDETVPEYDFTVLDGDNSLRAAYIRLMNKKLDECVDERGRSIVKKALMYGLDAIEGRV